MKQKRNRTCVLDFVGNQKFLQFICWIINNVFTGGNSPQNDTNSTSCDLFIWSATQPVSAKQDNQPNNSENRIYFCFKYCLRFPYKIMQIATAGGSWGPIVDIGERFHCFMLIYANETN